jgi:hypothetical protein
MKNIYVLSQGIAIFFGLTSLLGVLWFADSLGGVRIFAGIAAGFCYVMVAFFPHNRLTTVAARRFLIALCVIGISAELFLTVIDYSPLLDITFSAALIRLLPVAALIVLITLALAWYDK